MNWQVTASENLICSAVLVSSDVISVPSFGEDIRGGTLDRKVVPDSSYRIQKHDRNHLEIFSTEAFSTSIDNRSGFSSRAYAAWAR